MINRCPGLDQPADDRGVTVGDGGRQDCIALVAQSVRVRPVVQQQLHDFKVAVACRPLERATPVVRIDVWVSPRCEQGHDSVLTAVKGCLPERRLAVLVAAVHVCPGSNELTDALDRAACVTGLPEQRGIKMPPHSKPLLLPNFFFPRKCARMHGVCAREQFSALEHLQLIRPPASSVVKNLPYP